MRRFAAILIVLVGGLLILAVHRSLSMPGHLMRVTGQFAACPPRPSCVSSLAADAEQAIAPLRYEGDAAIAQQRLVRALRAMPGSRIEFESPGYLHVVFQTPTLRFRDDLELLVQPEGRIEVRSVSRFGYRDLGVNRARVEQLRTRFER